MRWSDTGYIVKETIKGLPQAGKKVLGVPGEALGKAMKAPFVLGKKVIDYKNKQEKGVEQYKKSKLKPLINKEVETGRKYREMFNKK